MRTPLLGFLLTAFIVAPVAHAGERLSVVELFTSEGCSSCPPAEIFLGELAQRPDVLALAFHVDYWDGLGWPDRFVIPEATVRQRGYARALRSSSVYTPQAVIDGTVDVVGSDRSKMMKALQSSSRMGLPIQIDVRGESLAIVVGAGERDTAGTVILIAFERSAISHIGRGENAGRTLTEYNVVRGMRTLGRYDGSQQNYRADVGTLPNDATDVAVIVQMQDQRAIMGAAQHVLRPPS